MTSTSQRGIFAETSRLVAEEIVALLALTWANSPWREVYNRLVG